LPDRLVRNRLADAVARARRERKPFVDLTLSNPTTAGIAYPPDLLASLASTAGLTYSPDALGSAVARAAVAADFSRRGIAISPDRIVLAASTSEAYSLLFKLLADPGDEVLVPRPSYPLFEHLTTLDAVRPRAYDLEFHGRWSVDLDSVHAALSSRTRALLIVSPNNPTGSFVTRAELDALASICAARGVALIADEVFADYELDGSQLSPRMSASAQDAALTFTLGGLSKSVGLPQVKVGWMAVSGPAGEVARALERLELICDTYLSVSTPVQVALPILLSRGAAIRDAIRARVRHNDRQLRQRAAAVPSCTVLPAEGGWYAVLQVPAVAPEEDLVLTLLNEDAVLVHPGYFFDFPREAFLVISLLPDPQQFADGIDRVLRRAAPPLHGPTA